MELLLASSATWGSSGSAIGHWLIFGLVAIVAVFLTSNLRGLLSSSDDDNAPTEDAVVLSPEEEDPAFPGQRTVDVRPAAPPEPE